MSHSEQRIDTYFFNRSCWFGRKTQTVLHRHFRRILRQRGKYMMFIHTFYRF